MEQHEHMVLQAAFVVYDHVVNGYFKLVDDRDKICGWSGLVSNLRETRKVFLGVFCCPDQARKAFDSWVEFCGVGKDCSEMVAVIPPDHRLELRPVSLNQPIPVVEVLDEVSSWVNP